MNYLYHTFILLTSTQLLFIGTKGMAVRETKYKGKAAAAAKNDGDINQFLYDIKQNLRRNNDDYIELTKKSPVLHGKTAYTKQSRNTLKHTVVNINKKGTKKFLSKSRRKDSDINLSLSVDDLLKSYVSDNSKDEEPTNMTNILKNNVLRLNDLNNQIASPTEKHTHSTIRKSISAISTRELTKTSLPLKISTSPKIPRLSTETPKVSLSLSAGSVTPILTSAKPISRSFTDTPENNKSMRKGQTRSNRFILEAYLVKKQLEEDLIKAHQNLMSMESSVDSDRIDVKAIPNPHELDMAAAKGHRLDKLRVKSRLCQRNVVMVEGPKYDARGHVYLRQYSPRKPYKDFAKTKMPNLVLPRCCNCCQKSVLGCQ